MGCCEAEHQESGQSCSTGENDRAFAEKDVDRSRQRRSQGYTKVTGPIKIKIGVIPLLAGSVAHANAIPATFISGHLFSRPCGNLIYSALCDDAVTYR